MTRTLALSLLAGLTLSLIPVGIAAAQPGTAASRTSAAPDAARNAEVPISKITLYRSGVGHFLRQGPINDNTLVSLKFDAAQINDVLKSLQVLDFGGRVAGVSYASKEPLSRRLSSFSLQIGDNPSLPTLLERLRGSPVTLATAEGNISGSVLSVEQRDIPQSGGDKPIIVKTPVVNLVTSSGIRTVAVPSITTFTIADKALAEELNRALSALAESRADRTKQVDVSLVGSGTRDLAIGYVHETPVWKTSYRLVLPEADPKPAADGKAAASNGVLQGWAIVENTTDQDWANVRLSLVSGRPVSFKMDLYEPLYVFRPDVPVPTVPGVMPKTYEGGTMKDKAGAPPGRPTAGADPMSVSKARRMSEADSRGEAPPSPMAPGSGGGPGGMRFEGANTRDVSAADYLDYSARPEAKAGEVGEVFQYTLENPVTIERQRSAMIPILTGNIGARRVSIYNMSDRADHPMRGVEITNSTNMQLLPGPLSVMDGTAYAGDATINQISAGDTRLLAYAVDLDVAVTTEPVNTTNLMKVRISKGTFITTYSNAYGVKYTFSNKDLKRARSIVVEHPKMQGFELKSAAKPQELTQNLYRFNIAAEAGKEAKLEVTQERVEQQSIGIFSYDLDTLVQFRQSGKLSEAALSAMREVFKKQGAVSDAERTVSQTDQQINALRSEQTRISQNMSGLDRQSDTYRNFLSKLNRQEAEIDKLTAAQESNRAALNAARRDLETTIANLDVE